jgi:hypothetical protein
MGGREREFSGRPQEGNRVASFCLDTVKDKSRSSAMTEAAKEK